MKSLENHIEHPTLCLGFKRITGVKTVNIFTIKTELQCLSIILVDLCVKKLTKRKPTLIYKDCILKINFQEKLFY